jgi:hypothetical protein
MIEDLGGTIGSGEHLVLNRRLIQVRHSHGESSHNEIGAFTFDNKIEV